MKSLIFFCAALFLQLTAAAQSSYKYSLDLNAIRNDQLEVSLTVPKLEQATALFTFPRIIPGTYKIADYGKFISNVKAFDSKGKTLPVEKKGTNQWKISKASTLSRITYTVDDIYDASQSHQVYPMAATNFETNNVILHTPGIFGFVDGLHQLPFEISISKPAQWYGATAMKPVSSTASQDLFHTTNLNDLYESPIMYGVPDTTSVRVGNATVQVAVYSPNKQVQSAQIAEWMQELLDAARQYLGGKLPTDKYAFLFYFKDPSLKHSFPAQLAGALEHPSSSFYYLFEAPAAQLKDGIVDIASHEFFHIITPLTIASTQVKEFNYNEPVLSKHLWLYEGATEYTSHHVQVKYGLKTPAEFLKVLSNNIAISRSYYKDDVAFAELSREAAGRHEKQFGNVYQKGALINACLDLLLLHLSDGNYGHRHLTYDLGIRFGKDRAFKDEELFDEIGKLTYPEVKDFLVKYVDGNSPIPYEEYFALAGFTYSPKTEKKIFSLGGFTPGIKPNGNFFIQPGTKFNEFGRKVGYKEGDEIIAFNGVKVNQDNFSKVVDSIRRNMKEGDAFTATVVRDNGSGKMETIQLKATAFKITETELHRIVPMANPTKKMELVRAAWLTTSKPPAKLYAANAADVSSIDGIVKAVYDVISGPPGPRNWDRFHSLFLPDAKMGAIVNTPGGPAFRTMTQEEYRRSNGSYFQEAGFFEEEIGRNVRQFGNVASVESAYQFRPALNAPVQQRGVNYLTLVQSEGRWWVANISWQSETKEFPIPSSILKN